MIKDIGIYIPTKGRYDKQKTFEILKNMGLSPLLVIEPQEADKYKDYPYILLPENDKGISYSRNFILDYAKAKGQKYIVQADDDIEAFYLKDKGKIKKNNRAFLEALEIFLTENKCGGMERQNIAWTRETDIIYNKTFYSLQFLYLPDISNRIRFVENTDINEDTDLFLQLRMNGKETFRTIKYSFQTPMNGYNKGGLYEWYKLGKDNIAKINLQKRWGEDIIRLRTDKNGRITERLNYKKINELAGISK